jgi:hypothetical protein
MLSLIEDNDQTHTHATLKARYRIMSNVIYTNILFLAGLTPHKAKIISSNLSFLFLFPCADMSKRKNDYYTIIL